MKIPLVIIYEEITLGPKRKIASSISHTPLLENNNNHVERGGKRGEMKDEERIWRSARIVQRAKREDKGNIMNRMPVRDQQGIAGSEGEARECGRNFIRDIVLSQGESHHTQAGEQMKKLKPTLTPPLSERRGTARKNALCVRPYTKSLHSACPLSLSPFVLTDAISTGKKEGNDVGCGDPLN